MGSPVSQFAEIEAELRRIRKSIDRLALSTEARSAYTKAEAAARLGVSVKTVTRMIHAGQLLTGVVGERTMIPPVELERVMRPRALAVAVGVSPRRSSPRLPPLPTAHGRNRSVAGELAKLAAARKARG